MLASPYSLNPSESYLAAQIRAAVIALQNQSCNVLGGNHEPYTRVRVNSDLDVLVSTVDYPDVSADCCELESSSGDSSFTIAIDAGFVASINWLAAAIWTNPVFQEQIGDCSTLPPQFVSPTEIPPGLELVWWASHYPYHQGPFPPLEPTWLQPRLNSLCESRVEHLRATIMASLQYVLLHEIAHCVLKHHVVLRNSPTTLSDKEVRRVLEMQADRWASTRLLQALYSTGSMVGTIPIHEILGMVLVYTIQHGNRMLQHDRPVPESIGYPPLWFRTEDTLAVNRWVHERAMAGKVHEEIKADRYLQEGRIASALLQLGNTHPLVAEWIGPVIDGSRLATYKSILSESRTLLNSLRESSQQL